MTSDNDINTQNKRAKEVAIPDFRQPVKEAVITESFNIYSNVILDILSVIEDIEINLSLILGENEPKTAEKSQDIKEPETALQNIALNHYHELKNVHSTLSDIKSRIKL